MRAAASDAKKVSKLDTARLAVCEMFVNHTENTSTTDSVSKFHGCLLTFEIW